eukprot:TRINITY_DN1071_c1_g1_i1.p1 TRINITY_DN1071_c1_g1~~TRINITY_DN1071_c1_g1_i1.p1  ORF type:complete len:230 (-),score=41.37 TRINITY_DN1071_c1_g1_i1:941-1591(-)
MASPPPPPTPSSPAVVLLQHDGAWDLPSACLECLRLRLYMKLAAVEHRVEDCPRLAGSDALPALERGAEVAYSGLQGASSGPLPFLRDRCGVDLDAALLSPERAEAAAYRALLEGPLQEASLGTLWLEPQNRGVAQQALAPHLPQVLRSLMGWQRAAAVRQKLFGLSAPGAAATAYFSSSASSEAQKRQIQTGLLRVRRGRLLRTRHPPRSPPLLL